MTTLSLHRHPEIQLPKKAGPHTRRLLQQALREGIEEMMEYEVRDKRTRSFYNRRPEQQVATAYAVYLWLDGAPFVKMPHQAEVLHSALYLQGTYIEPHTRESHLTAEGWRESIAELKGAARELGYAIPQPADTRGWHNLHRKVASVLNRGLRPSQRRLPDRRVHLAEFMAACAALDCVYRGADVARYYYDFVAGNELTRPQGFHPPGKMVDAEVKAFFLPLAASHLPRQAE